MLLNNLAGYNENLAQPRLALARLHHGITNRKATKLLFLWTNFCSNLATRRFFYLANERGKNAQKVLLS